jgi:hypothetical protein
MIKVKTRLGPSESLGSCYEYGGGELDLCLDASVQFNPHGSRPFSLPNLFNSSEVCVKSVGVR